MNIVSSALGYYPATRCPATYDTISGHSFGTGYTNVEIAQVADAFAGGRPIIVDRTLADAFTPEMQTPAHIVEGEISDTVGDGVGTWGTLLATQEYMEEHELKTALLVGHANHIGRVLMQARRLKLDAIAPFCLPDSFDKNSSQWWTRSKSLWLPREILGSVVLKAQNKL